SLATQMRRPICFESDAGGSWYVTGYRAWHNDQGHSKTLAAISLGFHLEQGYLVRRSIPAGRAGSRSKHSTSRLGGVLQKNAKVEKSAVDKSHSATRASGVPLLKRLLLTGPST